MYPVQRTTTTITLVNLDSFSSGCCNSHEPVPSIVNNASTLIYYPLWRALETGWIFQTSHDGVIFIIFTMEGSVIILMAKTFTSLTMRTIGPHQTDDEDGWIFTILTTKTA